LLQKLQKLLTFLHKIFNMLLYRLYENTSLVVRDVFIFYFIFLAKPRTVAVAIKSFIL